MEHNDLLAAITRFKDLSRAYAHSPGRHGSPEARRLYYQAQLELWRLAQLIVGVTHPDIQLALDTVRRSISAQLSCALKTPVTGASVRTSKIYRPLHWQDYQLTPELSIDPTIGGSAVLRQDLKKLKELLRSQSTALRSAIS